jgi:dTDP-4-dehydrorhamnose reductase
MKTVLILGSKGMLGQELVRVFGADDGYVVIGWDREDIDAADAVMLREHVLEIRPDIIFNAIAYNAVDACETEDGEYTKAQALNVAVPENLAVLARELGAILIHYSSDYVFGGDTERVAPYTEGDEAHPVQRYGETKRYGERRVLTVGGKAYVVRLSKLFGKPAVSAGGKKSFFGMMLEFGKTKSEVMVVDGERSCFTYAPDLAEASKALIDDAAEYGVYHLVNEGMATWYEGVQELYRLAGIETKIVPVSSDHFPRPAKRPDFSALANTKRLKLRPYTEALADFVRGNEH